MANAPLLLGLDLGTSGGRAILFDLAGHPVAQTSRSWKPCLPRPGWAELDPEAVWAETIKLLTDICDRTPAPAVRGIGISTQLATVFLDRSGCATFPALPWLDRRADAEARALEQEAGRESIARVAGRRAAAERPAAVARWMQRHEPSVWARTAWVCSLKDFLTARLTGRLATDEPNASYSLLFDVREKCWDAGLCNLAGIPVSMLPEVLSSPSVVGRVDEVLAGKLGLPAAPPVVAGGPDGTLAALGAGLTTPGIGVDVAGTTDVVLACITQPKIDVTGGLVTNVHACPGRWVLGGPTTTTGGVLAWFAETVSRADFTALVREAADVAAGADGVRCYPALSGERTPVWDSDLRAAFFGLALSHGRPHLVRAILEAAGCVVRRVHDAIARLGERVGEIRLVGGAAESDLWAQIRADVVGVPIRRMRVRDASALAAAMLAGVGAGVFPDVVTAAEEMTDSGELVEPQPATCDCYGAVYADFERIQALLQAFGEGRHAPDGPRGVR